MLLEDYATTDMCDGYNLMCSIEDHKRYHNSINDETSSCGGIPLPYHLTKEALEPFGLTINFIDIWIK